MKKILLAIILVIALISIACQSTTYMEKTKVKEAQVDAEVIIEAQTDPEVIRASTLLIVVEDIQKTGVTLAYDMATLVKIQNENFLVTHNHWGDMLQDMNIIELRDADNKMLRPMYASEFKSLIVYQDAGTMILRLPGGLPDSLTPASLERSTQLTPGDTVQVAHHSQPNRNQVEILDAVVEEISVSKDAPVYILRSLNGKSLQPGDSGGGVWYNGKLVANTWTVTTKYSVVDAAGTVDPASETLTDRSHAAIFPEGFK
jgi:thioredoxin-related protein